MDLTGALDFDELNDIYDLALTPGENAYDVPEGTRMVKAVIDDYEDRLLDYVDPTEFFRLNRAQEGDPIRWTRYANQIFLHPTPDGDPEYIIMRKMDPAPLVLDGDTTPLSATWDAAVLMLAVYHGMLAIAENEQRANSWMIRAVTYIQTRATQAEMFTKESGLGLAYALPLEKRMSAMSGGNVAGLGGG